ncbi:flagellar motor switch phosphatase FliY [Alloiococcus sp. CFN-8]|uniref:flagellar motor switch phosphatase FliY n=1 Tax=Alloiococcus sp. CFN-8 TaxID=3416081 RepID=UPI003CF2866A
MTNDFLSQEEIDALLSGASHGSIKEENAEIDERLTDMESDLLGEIGNISMGSAATALSQIINNSVSITTPVVEVTCIRELRKSFKVPNIVLEVEYTSGISGRNILVMKTTDASVIANLMMGGDGEVSSDNLSELEVSAVQEAMNQMIGSSATSMATMLSRGINISPPTSTIWYNKQECFSKEITEDEPIIKVSFRMTIGSLVDSNIMQILPVSTARKIISIMMGTEGSESKPPVEMDSVINTKPIEVTDYKEEKEIIVEEEKVKIMKAEFTPLKEEVSYPSNKNIELILDVPLEISVVLGKTKKSIREILNLGVGSLVELDKLAEEPVEILVNGKKVALGEVVVVDENFGVRITSIVSGADRVRTLKE